MRWAPFCRNRDCPCLTPDPWVCDEYKRSGRGRCGECGWPESVHDLRDELERVGLELTISARRVNE